MSFSMGAIGQQPRYLLQHASILRGNGSEVTALIKVFPDAAGIDRVSLPLILIVNVYLFGDGPFAIILEGVVGPSIQRVLSVKFVAMNDS